MDALELTVEQEAKAAQIEDILMAAARDGGAKGRRGSARIAAATPGSTATGPVT